MYLKYLRGLNPLRFFAAFFVIIGHAQISLTKMGIVDGSSLAFLNKGSDAVEFFFTLSGLLITYLLLNEIKVTGTVSIKDFYLRRIFRIWPLYFLIVIIGFLLLGVVYPRIYARPFFNFPSTWTGLSMFIFFIPNYAARNYSVGLLFPLWSIGVEEQFYIFWAPLVKVFQKWVLLLIILFATSTTVFFLLVYFEIVKVPDHLLGTLKFFKIHFMAIGSIFGYVMYHYYHNYRKSLFTGTSTQVAIWMVIAYHYCIGFPFSDNVYFHIFLAFMYGLLILNVSIAKKKIIDPERKPFIYLGVISYGLYMYHMVVDYFLRIIYSQKFVLGLPKGVIVPLYYLCLVSLTIFIAAISYNYFEKYFIKLKLKFSKI